MEKLKAIYRFYRDGFAEMTIGRKLWVLIILKLAIMFLILRPFFFPNRLKEEFETDVERAEEVRRQLSRPAQSSSEIPDASGQVPYARPMNAGGAASSENL